MSNHEDTIMFLNGVARGREEREQEIAALEEVINRQNNIISDVACESSPMLASDAYYEVAMVLNVKQGGSVIETAEALVDEAKRLREES